MIYIERIVGTSVFLILLISLFITGTSKNKKILDKANHCFTITLFTMIIFIFYMLINERIQFKNNFPEISKESRDKIISANYNVSYYKGNEDILRKNKIKTIKLYGNQKRIKKLCEMLHFNDRCKYINYGEEADFNKKDIYEYIEIK